MIPYTKELAVNKAQRKARLKHLNSIRDGSYLRKKQEAQRKQKITDLLLQNHPQTSSEEYLGASRITWTNKYLHQALTKTNLHASLQCVNPYSKPIPQHFPIQ